MLSLYAGLSGLESPNCEPSTVSLELTPLQIAVLERLAARGFRPAAFRLYANVVGVRKGNCAALLAPADHDRMKLFAEPCYLIEGNLSVRVTRGGKQWFVWKKKQVEATSQRLAELARFTAELTGLLGTGA